MGTGRNPCPQFVSLLIAAGKHPKYIATQAGHASARFTLDRYGHLLERITPQPVEWIDDLLGGWDQIGAILDAIRCRQANAGALIAPL
jgi:hypothetical protein